MNHPLHQFIYCPKCGANTFIERNEKAKQCTTCGFVYYFQSFFGSSLFHPEIPPERFYWCAGLKNLPKDWLDLPGGFVDMFESAEDAAHREVKRRNRTGYYRMSLSFSIPNLYMYCGFEVHTVDMFFECHVKDSIGVHAEDDAAEIVIPLEKEELKAEEFGLMSIKKAIRLYKENNC